MLTTGILFNVHDNEIKTKSNTSMMVGIEGRPRGVGRCRRIPWPGRNAGIAGRRRRRRRPSRLPRQAGTPESASSSSPGPLRQRRLRRRMTRRARGRGRRHRQLAATRGAWCGRRGQRRRDGGGAWRADASRRAVMSPPRCALVHRKTGTQPDFSFDGLICVGRGYRCKSRIRYKRTLQPIVTHSTGL